MSNSLRAGWIAAAFSIVTAPLFGQASPCDLTGNGTVNSADVDAAVNMTLGVTPCTANIMGTGTCNVSVVQRVVNASLPGGACVVGTPKTVTLTWVASASTGVTGYNILRSTTAGGPYSTVNTSVVPATTYADSIVQNGLVYYYVVKAVNGSGQESGPSNEATASIPTT